MSKCAAYMTTLFDVEDVRWTPHGTIANTLPAHRVLHEVQATHDPATTLSLLMNLYEAYFTRGMHPSAGETLRGACVAAGLGDDQVESVVGDESVGLVGVKEKIGEQVSDGVDSVPHVVVEGRRRDFTLVGAKEVEEYVKVLEQVAKEA
jgi:predicted DsbA family dithiol-disulfide isomerase